MKKKVPLKPTKQETLHSIIYSTACIMVWFFLIGGIIHLVSYYFFISVKEGFFAPESIKICTYIIIGAFMFLFIYKDKAKEIFKIKACSDNTIKCQK
ncbi:MAG: hypothetical protein QXR48_03825 [Candidatus Woesearchaeota archaeon]